jgi:ABC-type transporter Mla subunit MlaD
MLFDFATNAARSVLRVFGGAEQEIEKHSPIDERLHDAIDALHRTADAMDKHVEVLEGLALSLPALTEVLARLSDQLGEALRLASPLEAAEHQAAGISHLFRRHRHAAAADKDAEPPA